MIYLDSAATTLQKPPSVPQAVAQALATMTSPGSGSCRCGRRSGVMATRPNQR